MKSILLALLIAFLTPAASASAAAPPEINTQVAEALAALPGEVLPSCEGCSAPLAEPAEERITCFSFSMPNYTWTGCCWVGRSSVACLGWMTYDLE